MAGTKALNVRMNFQVDTTQARQQIQQLGAQLNSITKASSFSANSSLGITQEILQATKAAAQLKTALAEAINPLTGNLNLSAFNDQLIASKMSLMDYRNQLSALGTTGNQAFNSLTRSIMTAETPLLRTGKAAQQMWTVLGNTVRWQATSSMIHGIMSTASQAMNYVKSLDSSLNSIRIVTGQSQAQMERFAQTANKAAKELNTSTNAYAKASLIYYQQGLSNEEVEKRTATTVKLANVSGQTAAKVSDQLTAIWNNFYDGSKSLEYYADVMTALGASTASSTDEIAKGLEKFSSIAKTTGLSYEYATSALSTVVAATRQSADSVGTSFKTLFSRLQGLSLGETLDDGTTLNKYSKALNVIGVNIKNANGSLKDMDDILDEIGNKWTSLSKAEQVALAQTVGGARNYTGLVSLMDNWDSFQTNLKTAQQAQGTLQNQADIYAQSWEAASNHVKVASETIYKNLLDDKFFKGMTHMFGYMLDAVGEVTNQMGGFKGVMSGLANFAFTTFAPQISKSFANIGSSIYGFTPQGQERVLDLRKQAMSAVTANVRLSEYDTVDKLAHSYNQAFVNRQVAYDNAIQKGRISEYQTPVYQTLLTNMGQQEDALIRQAENYYKNQEATNLQAGRYATAANTAINAISKQDANINLRNWKDIGLQNRITAYRTALTREENAASLLQYYRKGESEYGIQNQNLKMAATGLQRIALGAKAVGDDLDKTLPGLGKFHTQLESLGGDITKLTEDQLKGLLDENTRIGQYLTAAAKSSDDTATVTSDLILSGIKDYVTDQLKLDVNTDEGKATLDKVMTAVTAKDLNISERASLLQKAGLTEQQQRGILGDIEGQTVPSTIAMSQALTTNIGMLASLGQMYSGVSAAIKTFGDENATAGQQVASLTSLFMAGSMAVKPFQNFVASAGKEVTIFGNTLKTLGGTTIKNGPLGLAIAGILGATIGGIALYKDQQKNTLNGAIKNYNEAISVATQLTADAQAAYENLVTAQGTHNNLLTDLHNLQYGTVEFTQALLNANDTATSLIESYDLIYGKDYTYGQYGEIEFQKDALDLAIDRAEAEAKTAALNKEQATYASKILENYKNIAEVEAENILYDAKNEGITAYYTNEQGAHLGEGLTVNGLIGAFQQRLFETNNNLSGTAFLQELTNQAQERGSIVNFDRILSALNFKDLEQLGNFLEQANTLQDQYLNDASYQEALNALTQGGYSKFFEERNAYIQGLVDVTATNNLPPNFKNKDLTSYIASQYLTKSENEDFINSVLTFANKAGTTTFGEGRYSNPKAWYAALFNEEAGDLSDEAIFQKVSTGIIDKILTDPHFFDNLELPAELSQITGLDKWMSKIGGLTNLADTLQKYNLPNLENLNYQQITSEFDKILDYEYFSVQGKQQRHLKDTETNKALLEYRDYAEDVYNNQLNDLATAMLRGIGDGLLNGATETEKGSKFEELVTGLAGRITDNNKEVMSSLTYGALKQATNAMINANEVGGETAKTMYSLLLRGRTQTGGFDAATQAILQNYNFDNSLASIYSNNNLKRYAQNQAQRDKYIELFSSQIEDIGKEKGWFQMLYNSSGFSDVLDKINSQFQATGQITAQYITDLAGKSEELSQFLKVSSDNTELLNVNAGGLAAIFEEINKGTSGITASNISSEFVSAMSKAESRSAANASAFEVVDNLDLGRSGLDFLDFFQDMGKEMYQANKAGWGFYSDPIQNIIDKIGGSKVRQVYMEANSHPDWNFQQMWNYMKTNPDSAGFMTFMESMAGKKGKGGGGPADVMKYLYDTLGGAGFTEEDWNKLGFRVDAKGGFFLREGSDGSREYTQEQLVKNLTNLLMSDYGWTEEDANNYAQVIMSTASTSGQVGQALDTRGAQAGFKDLMKGPITQEEYDAYFRRYGALMGFIDDAEKTGREKFDEAFKAGGGSVGLNLKKEEWQGVTGLRDLAERSNKQGVTYTRDGETYTIGGTGSSAMDILQLANAYGAAVVGENGQLTGQLNYNKLLTMVETMGGTEEDLIKMLENDQETVKNLVAQTASGEDIKWTGEGTVRDWVKDVHAAQGDTTFKYSNLSAEAANMAYMYEHMIMSQNEDGTWSWHYETQEDKNRKAAEEQHKADVAKRQQLKEQFGYSDTDIDEAIALGSDYDTLINNATNNEQRDNLKDQGYSDEEIDKIIQAQQDNHLSLDDAKAFVNSGWETVADWEKSGKTTNPNKQQSNEEQFGEPQNPTESETTTEPPIYSEEYVEGKLEEKVDNLTPDDRSLGERWSNFTEGIGAIAGAVIGKVLNPFGVKAEAEEGVGAGVTVTNPELNTDKTVIPASKYHGTILLSDAGDYEAAKAFYDQIDDQGAFQSFRDNVWGNQGSDLYFQHEMNTEQQEELDRLRAEADNARYVLEHYDDELMAGETGLGITKGESLGITKEEAAQEAANRQEAADFYKYQNGMSPAERLAAISDAQTLLHTEGADKLTPFQKFLMNSIGEIVDYQGIMADATEDENGPNGKKKNAQVDEETGELVDEEGNPIDMPQGQQQSSGTGSGRDSGGDTGDWWRPGGGNDKNKYTPFGNGIWGDSNGNYVIDNGDGTYSPFTPPNESNIVSPDSGGGYDPHQSAVACFAAGTQVLMANGKTKNIEDVLIDEIVISYDELQQKFVCNKVIKFDKHIDTIDLVQITFDNGEILKLTPSHPLYSTKGWKSLDIKKAFLAHGVVTTLLNIGDIILGINKSASVINIEKITDQQFYTTYNIDIENSHTYLVNGFIAHNKAASGQNNARLLAYASGKEGHIAVTGELGPELRVKSDGSMDILGKTGREYAWIEPDDRIYTASQSAGILKSNKIPGLEGLAKGINNYIPGYEIGADWNNSGSSGGGGGGGRSRGGGGGTAAEKDPRYDPKTLKIRDVLERYYTILQQIDNITKAVERFSKVADRAWGRERIRAIEHQNELQQKQYEAQKKYIAEIEGYLETDQSAMTTMIREFVEGWNKAVDENTDPNNTMEKISWAGAQFDQDGVLTNYRDFVEKLVEQYNQNAASANQEVQYKFQEQLKDIQMYTDTLNLYEEQINALEDIKNAILDTAIKVVSYEVEYKLELSGDTDRILNFQADKYKDDVYQAAKYLELLDQRADLTRKNLETVTEGIMKTLGNYAGENMRVGALHTLDELGVYGTNKFEIPEELLEELDEDDEEDAEKLKELQAERSRNITKQIGAWLEEAYATNKDEVEKIEKMLSFSSEEGAGDFTYDEDWRDTYDSWEDYYNEVINKTDNDTERFIDNYEEIISRLNGLVDFQKIRTQVSDWLEELRTKDAEAAIEIDKIIRYTEDGQIANYSDVLEKLNEANVKLNDEFINLLYTDQEAFFKAMSDFQNNPGWVDFTTEHKDQLTNWMDAIYQYLESLQDTYEQTIEQLGDSIKATAKQMDAAIDEFDYYGDVYKTFGNIVDLTNRHMTDVSQDFFNTLNNKSMDNSINKIKATVTNYHLLQNELAEVTKQYNEMQARANAATGEEQIYLQQSADKLKEQLDIANNQYEDAHKAFLSSWEDALSKMAENYKAAVEEAAKNFEQGFSPLFNTLALLQAQFDREKALGDLYVDNYQRIHDLNKLNRDIQLSIDDTDNLKGKERLRDLQAEINQLQEDGTELSEYDLDILDKKYKLELARQALEDAKDAKSMVRLARDNNGNWSYVYTANQDDVDKAEQDYEDAIREMEQANEDYIDNIQDQILQVQQEAQQAILALQPEDFATYEDYLAAVNNIQNSMYQTLDFLRSQLNNAFGNNEWLDPYIVDRYGINDHDLTTDFGDTTLAGLLDNPDIDKAIKKAKENFEDNLKQPVLDAFIEYSERQDEVYQAAEHDIATIGKDFQDEMENIADSSEYQVEVVTNLFERVQNSFNDMAAVVDEKTKKHLDEATMLVDVYEKLVEAITKVKELSGENLPIEGGQFIGKIDSWAEIQKLNKELAEHGDYRTLEDLTELDPEDLQDRKDAMQKASEKIGEWMEALLVDSVDEETRTAIQNMVEKNDDGLITNYKQVISKLAQLEKTDENKDILKEIKKWRATEQKAMYTSPQQVYKENEGLYTNFIAGDQFTKDYLGWITDQLMYNQMKTASDNGVTDTEKAEIETYLSAHGGVWVKKGDIEEFFDSWEDWKAWYEKNKYVAPSGGGGDGGGDSGWAWWEHHTSDGGYIDTQGAVGYDTGGFTGRWQSADTGMYTGEWSSGSVRRNGKLAWLHQKELVLNAHDTENFLDAMKIVKQLDNLTNWMANGLGDLIMPKVTTESSELEQNVHIKAEFPNVTDHNEIEQAFNNLVNMASQYANRK